jgi:mono/diheme cytochrome c family protein
MQRRAILLITAAITASGCGSGGSDNAAGSPSPFASVCAMCHGPQGEGTARAPEIRHPDHGYARWVVRNGREGKGFPAPMLAYGAAAVSDVELDHILDWLSALPAATTGQALYLDYCGNCHGPDGRGGTVEQTAYGTVPEQITDEVRSGEGGTDYGARTHFMPAIPASALSDAQLTSIYRFMGVPLDARRSAPAAVPRITPPGSRRRPAGALP